MTTPVLILPGRGNSGPQHWQSLWEKSYGDFRRVHQREWNNPKLADWLKTLQRHVSECEFPPVLVAHSLSCALIAHYAAQSLGGGVKGALLVSPSDVESPTYTPRDVNNFSPIPLFRFPFPSIVVASTDDPRVSIERAEFFARSWGSRFVNIGAKGHINAASGLGDWPDGLALLQTLAAERFSLCDSGE